jgi:tetratricopeptide (TPR) repeat protein
MKKSDSARLLIVVFLALLWLRASPALSSNYYFLTVAREVIALNNISYDLRFPICSYDPLVNRLQGVTDLQRLALISTLYTMGCLNEALLFIEPLSMIEPKHEYTAFQQGRIHWAKGETSQAILEWEQVENIEYWLVKQGDIVLLDDQHKAASWYEAAILLANTPPVLAHAVTVYRERLRSRISNDVFVERLYRFEEYIEAETMLSYRIRGLLHYMESDYLLANKEFRQAIELGLDDSETWYWLAESELRLNDFYLAEPIFEQSLNASIQVSWRRAWYLDRLGRLLLDEGRPQDALPLFVAAVELGEYYARYDSLALVYLELNEPENAEIACLTAKALVPSLETKLRCEKK